MPTKSCRSRPTTSGCVEIAATPSPSDSRSTNERGRVAANVPSGTATSSIRTKPPSSSEPVTSAARHTIGPTGEPDAEPPKKLIVAHDVPKSPCSSLSTYFPYCTIAGRSVPSRWCALRDLLRRGVLQVDEEPGWVGRHLQVDRERDHREDPEQDDRDAEPPDGVADHRLTSRLVGRSPRAVPRRTG